MQEPTLRELEGRLMRIEEAVNRIPTQREFELWQGAQDRRMDRHDDDIRNVRRMILGGAVTLLVGIAVGMIGLV